MAPSFQPVDKCLKARDYDSGHLMHCLAHYESPENSVKKWIGLKVDHQPYTNRTPMAMSRKVSNKGFYWKKRKPSKDTWEGNIKNDISHYNKFRKSQWLEKAGQIVKTDFSMSTQMFCFVCTYYSFSVWVWLRVYCFDQCFVLCSLKVSWKYEILLLERNLEISLFILRQEKEFGTNHE